MAQMKAEPSAILSAAITVNMGVAWGNTGLAQIGRASCARA
jgi:hypothetical protein